MEQPLLGRTPAELRVRTGDTERRVPLADGSRWRIGRAPGCEIPVTDPRVSVDHAEVLFDGKTWRLQRTHGSNPIYMAGQEVESAALVHGSRFRIGGTEFELACPDFPPLPCRQHCHRERASSIRTQCLPLRKFWLRLAPPRAARRGTLTCICLMRCPRFCTGPGQGDVVRSNTQTSVSAPGRNSRTAGRTR